MMNNPYQRHFNDAKDNSGSGSDDLYGGFDQIASTDTIHKTITMSKNTNEPAPLVGGGHGPALNPFAPSDGHPSVRPPTQAFHGAGGTGEAARPMTSVQGAGYSSQKPRWDPLKQAGVKSTTLTRKQENKKSPKDIADDLEQEVNELLLASTIASTTRDKHRALEKASAAVKRERVLTKHRDKNGLAEQVNMDLTYAVRFNLARQYHASGMHSEALSAYNQIVRSKQFPYAGRLRVNMGNIYYDQKRFPAAIKMYRMAMDQLSNQNSSSREIRFRIMQNIGNSFVQLGQYQEAIQSYESVMAAFPNTQTGFNLLLCHYSHGNLEKMKKAFSALLNVPSSPGSEEEDEGVEQDPLGDESAQMNPKEEDQFKDDLKIELQSRRAKDENYVYKAARLIAPMLDPNDLAAGYNWVIAQLKEPVHTDEDGEGKPVYPRLAMEMEIALGIAFLKRKDISRAIQVFKEFERQESKILDQAATNLSFLYFLEGDLKNAEVYAEKAVRADRYNAKALVNKANFMFKKGFYEGAKELYLEAIGVEADCVEAIYNLGLVNKRLGNLKAALMAFSKLHRLVPKDPMVMYQIANIYDRMDEPTPATKWFKILHGAVPTDPTILYRIGALHLKDGDETAAFHNYSDSYNVYPVNMDIISWLGVWYVKQNLYERAIPFFERAAEIEPDEIKWKLMVASCYRRMGSLPKALACYRSIHKQDPDNAECLRYMCNILKDMGRDQDYNRFADRLQKAERNAAKAAHMSPSTSQTQFVQSDDVHEISLAAPSGVPENATTPYVSPRKLDDDLGMEMGMDTKGTANTRLWEGNNGPDEIGPESKFESKHQDSGMISARGRGGVLVNLDSSLTSNSPPKKKKAKAKPKNDDNDEWGDIDLGMDLLPDS